MFLLWWWRNVASFMQEMGEHDGDDVALPLAGSIIPQNLQHDAYAFLLFYCPDSFLRFMNQSSRLPFSDVHVHMVFFLLAYLLTYFFRPSHVPTCNRYVALCSRKCILPAE